MPPLSSGGGQQLRELNIALSRQLARNHKLAQKFVTAEEAVRRDIARELHDEIGQNITAIRMQAGILKRVGNTPSITTSADMIDSLSLNIYDHPEFTTYIDTMNKVFAKWQAATTKTLKALNDGFQPKELIHTLSENLLTAYNGKALLDKYDVYQHLMNYWAEVMQDDCYLIAADGWKAETYRIIVENKKGKKQDKGWDCDLMPKPLVINRYFAEEQQAIDTLKAELEQKETEKTELLEEHSGEEGTLKDISNKTDATAGLVEAIEQAWNELDPASYKQFAGLQKLLAEALSELEDLNNHRYMDSLRNGKGKITAKAINERLKLSIGSQEKTHLEDYQRTEKTIKAHRKAIGVLRADALTLIDDTLLTTHSYDCLTDIEILREFLALLDGISSTKKQIKEAEEALDKKLYEKYPTLDECQVKQLVVDDKWLPVLDRDVHSEMDRISQQLTGRIKELAERYELPLPKQTEQVNALEKTVAENFGKMGFVWK